MSKAASAINTLPAAALKGLRDLGADLAMGRLRRKESLKTWAELANPQGDLGVLEQDIRKAKKRYARKPKAS